VFAPQGVETFGRKAGALRDDLVEGKTALLRGLDRQVELAGVDEATGNEQTPQVLRLALHVGGAHQAVAEDDATVPLLGAKQQQTGFPRKADDLKNIPEAQILEAPDQAHRAPRSGRRRAAQRPHLALHVSIGRQDGYLISGGLLEARTPGL